MTWGHWVSNGSKDMSWFFHNTIIVLYSLAPAFSVPITLTSPSLCMTMASKSIQDFCSYCGISCSSSVTFYYLLSKDEIVSVSHKKWVLMVLKLVWETSSLCFPAPFLSTPQVTGFQQLHNIPEISLRKTYPWPSLLLLLLLLFSHTLLTPSQFFQERSHSTQMYEEVDIPFWKLEFILLSLEYLLQILDISRRCKDLQDTCLRSSVCIVHELRANQLTMLSSRVVPALGAWCP